MKNEGLKIRLNYSSLKLNYRFLKLNYRFLKLNYSVLGLMLCSLLPFLTACSNGDDDIAGGPVRLHLMVAGQCFHDITTRSLPSDFTTRALPANYLPYEQLTPQTDIDHAKIQAYITTGDNELAASGVFSFRPTDDGNGGTLNTWTSTIPSVEAGANKNYHIFGFMPAEDAGKVTIVPLPIVPEGGTTPIASYNNGATMTITGLNALTPADISIIVGVKGTTDNTSDISDVGIQLGDFTYECSDGNHDSYVYLLLDHLYSGLHIKFSIGTDYSKLRTIKVTKLTMKAEAENNQTVATVNASVTVRQLTAEERAAGTSPLSVVFANNATTESIEPTALYQGEERELTTTPQNFLACFAPNSNRKFVLETTYNVYDKKGNLIRENCTAKNTVVVNTMTPGQIYTLNITVVPTYLYMLSEPDLDNPTVVLSE